MNVNGPTTVTASFAPAAPDAAAIPTLDEVGFTLLAALLALGGLGMLAFRGGAAG